MRCWCGTEYQGSVCPVCSIKREIEEGADRIADAQRDAAEAQHRDAEALRESLAAQAEEQAWRMEVAAAQATQDQRQNIANSFRLQSTANDKRASELFSAGLLDEALHHAEQAIHLDQGNLGAYLTAGEILQRQDKLELALTYFRKATRLLRTVDYRHRPDWFVAVLWRLPKQEALEGEFVSALQQAASSWKCSTEAIQLILALHKGRLHAASVSLAESLISRGPELQLYACLYAVSPTTSAENAERLRTFLDQFRDNRSMLVEQVCALRSAEILPTAVRDEVMRLVQSTYTAWGPYIEEQVAAIAERSRQAAAAKPPENPWAGAIQGGLIGLGGGIPVFGMVIHPLFRSAGDGFFLLFMLVAVIGGGVAGNLFAGRDRDRRVNEAWADSLEKAQKAEREVRDKLGLKERSPSMNPATAPPIVDKGPKGLCPNCDSIIPLNSLDCPNQKCNAQFGPNSAWKVKPL